MQLFRSRNRFVDIILFYPLNTWLIVGWGWRAAFAIFGLLVTAVTVPLAAVLYRDAPEVVDDPRDITVDPPPTPGRDWTLGRALRSVPFWAVFAMWGFGVIGYQIVTTHQVAHALDRGFSAVTLGWLFGLGGACTVAGNVVGGALSDRWGRERVFALGSAIGIAGIGCLSWLDGPQHLPRLLGYVVSGVGFGMRISLLAAIPTDLFAGRHLGVILGAAHGGGMAVDAPEHDDVAADRDRVSHVLPTLDDERAEPGDVVPCDREHRLVALGPGMEGHRAEGGRQGGRRGSGPFGVAR